jgi:hypothetical protein
MTRQETFIRDELLKRGIPASGRGLEYLTQAILKYTKLCKLTGPYGLYAEVAKDYPGATPNRVERCMRHAIQRSHDKEVTNGNFISYMAYQLAKKEKQNGHDK